MNRYLLDVNLVLALLDRRHLFHDAAYAWAARDAGARWLTCPVVQNGVLRVASRPRYPNTLGTVSAVRLVLADFCTMPRHEFCPGSLSLTEPGIIARPELMTPNAVTDLYLLALAVRHGARLATFDRRIPAHAVEGGAEALELIEV